MLLEPKTVEAMRVVGRMKEGFEKLNQRIFLQRLRIVKGSEKMRRIVGVVNTLENI